MNKMQRSSRKGLTVIEGSNSDLDESINQGYAAKRTTVAKSHHKGTPANRMSRQSLLYEDREDQERLESMNEFEREAELARRYDQQMRQKQRDELLKNRTRVSQSTSWLELKTRKERKRRRLLESESSESDVNETSPVKDDSSDEHFSIISKHSELSELIPDESSVSQVSDWDIPTPSTSNQPQLDERITNKPSVEPVDGLFIDDKRVEDIDERHRKKRNKVLNDLSIDVLQSIRLSSDRILHMLEHPEAERYLSGCYVKVPQNQAKVEAGPDCKTFICNIVGIKECPLYKMPDGRVCHYLLRLRLAPKASAKFDRSYPLNELINTNVTQSEFEEWKQKLREFDTVEDLSKKMQQKLHDLRNFTFTDHDVQIILERNKKRNIGSLSNLRCGNLVKQSMAIQHEMDTLNVSLSNSNTDFRTRTQYRQRINQLMEEKEDVDAQISTLKAGSTLNYYSQRATLNLKRKTTQKPLLGVKVPGQSENLTVSKGSKLGQKKFLERRSCKPMMMWDIRHANSKNKFGSDSISSTSDAPSAELSMTSFFCDAVNDSSLNFWSVISDDFSLQKKHIDNYLMQHMNHQTAIKNLQLKAHNTSQYPLNSSNLKQSNFTNTVVPSERSTVISLDEYSLQVTRLANL